MTPRFLFLLFVIITALSCNDDIEGLFPDPLDPLQKTFRSSLFIEVKDTSGAPVRDALIQIGNVNGKTDFNGFLFLENVPVGNTSYLTAKKDGYFIGSRRFYPSEGQSSYIRIILVSNQRIAFFSSSAGASISIESGVTFTFPKDAYELESGNAFNGEVFVSAIAIKADDPDLSFKMPGDLVGLDQNNEKGALASLGMVAVELRNSSGDLLRIKEGATVGLRMEVPASMLNVALPTLPMWHFDETNGIWREEGYATLVENAYLTEVSHFSFWNYDAWFEIIKWGTTVLYENNSPAGQIRVCITIPSLNATKCDYTNENGIICGMVAANQVLEIKVYDPCSEQVYSENIGPYNDSVIMQPIIISPPGRITITGIAVDCENKPLREGIAIITYGENEYFTSLELNSGRFEKNLISCSNSDIKVKIVDTQARNTSLSMSFPYAPLINADTINVCQSIGEYLILEIEGIPEPLYFFSLEFSTTDDGSAVRSKDSIQNEIFFIFDGYGPGQYNRASANISIQMGIESYFYCSELDMEITKYGKKGDYVQGNIRGILKPNGELPQVESFPFTGRFSVLRE